MRQEMLGFWDAMASAGHMQTVSTSVKTDNHTNTSALSFLTGWMLFLLMSVLLRWHMLLASSNSSLMLVLSTSCSVLKILHPLLIILSTGKHKIACSVTNTP